jgi:hypothetical protein
VIVNKWFHYDAQKYANRSKPETICKRTHEIFEASFKRKDMAACHLPLQLQHELCGEHQQQSQHFRLDKTQS